MNTYGVLFLTNKHFLIIQFLKLSLFISMNMKLKNETHSNLFLIFLNTYDQRVYQDNMGI